MSCGRLFDAVSSLIEISDYSNFEGQAAMNLEFIAKENVNDFYEFDLIENGKLVVDWTKIILGLIEDLKKGLSIGSYLQNFITLLSK